MLMPQEVFKTDLTLYDQFSPPPESPTPALCGANEPPCIALEIEVAQ